MTTPVVARRAAIGATLFLGALTFTYVSAAVGAGEYRSRFLGPAIDDLSSPLFARSRYRSNPAKPA
jgi:hypothetical protein